MFHYVHQNDLFPFQLEHQLEPLLEHQSEISCSGEPPMVGVFDSFEKNNLQIWGKRRKSVEKVFAAIFITILVSATGCFFDTSGIGATDWWVVDSGICEQSPCKQDAQTDSVTKPDKGKFDSDMLLADGPTSEGPIPDVLPPDSLVSDSLAPDGLKPCSLTCLNGGTCKFADAGTEYCDCPTGYDPATKCGSCLSGYCGYSTGGCQLKPEVTSAYIVCPTGCNLNQNQYDVYVDHANNPTNIKLTPFWEMGCNFSILDLGSFNPSSVSSPSDPLKVVYTTPKQKLSSGSSSYVKVEIELSIAGKSDCTVVDTTSLKINFP